MPTGRICAVVTEVPTYLMEKCVRHIGVPRAEYRGPGTAGRVRAGESREGTHAHFVFQVYISPAPKNFSNLPLVRHANRPHMRRGHGGAYLSYGKVRQTYRGAPCRISGSGDRRKGARGRIPRGHSCAFCVSSLYLTSPKTIEMTDWAPV